VRFFVAALALGKLLGEAPFLVYRIVQLTEGISQLEATDVKLEALYPFRLIGLDLGER
jgi:hypothetical protein